jgi:hypothetical protein
MESFKTHNDKEIEVNGTSLVGEISADYNDLKEDLWETSMEMVTKWMPSGKLSLRMEK